MADSVNESETVQIKVEIVHCLLSIVLPASSSHGTTITWGPQVI